MASPTKVISVSIMTNVPKADTTIQGAVRSELVPCFKSSPKLGVGGGSPKPKKSSAVIAVIAAITVKGTKVIKVDIALGRMCLNIILQVEAPIIRAAET